MRSLQRTANQIGFRMGLVFGSLFLLAGMAWGGFNQAPSLGLLIGTIAFAVLSYAISSVAVFLVEYRRIRQMDQWYQFWGEYATTEDSLSAYADALSTLKQVGLL